MSTLIEKLRSVYLREYPKEYSQRLFSEPKIYHGGDSYNLSKRWYVYYSYRDSNDRMARQPPVYLNVNRDFKTKVERLKRLNVICQALSEMLKDGYSPYHDGKDPEHYTAASAIDFSLELKRATVEPSTFKIYDHIIKHFKKFLVRKRLDKMPITAINKGNINDFLNQVIRKSNATTRNNNHGVISSIFGILEDNELIARNFVRNIKKLPTKPEKNRTYSLNKVDEIYQYLEINDPVLLLYIKLVSYNFLRPIEVCRLKCGDIDLVNKQLFVKTKTGKKVKIIPDIVVKELRSLDLTNDDYLLFTPTGPGYWDAEEMSRRNHFGISFNAIKKHFKLSKHHNIYSFRHTFITKLYNELKERYTVSEVYDRLKLITGHQTLEALLKYLRDIDAELPEDYSEMLK